MLDPRCRMKTKGVREFECGLRNERLKQEAGRVFLQRKICDEFFTDHAKFIYTLNF
jgi:hypothetical protein